MEASWSSGRGGHSGGGTRFCANHISMVDAIVLTLDSSSTSVDAGVFSKEKVDTLHRLMSRLETSTTASFSFVNTSNSTTALNASSTHFDDP